MEDLEPRVYELPAYDNVSAVCRVMTTGKHRVKSQVTYVGEMTTKITVIISDPRTRGVLAILTWNDGAPSGRPGDMADGFKVLGFAVANLLAKPPGSLVSPLIAVPGTVRVPSDVRLQDTYGRFLTAKDLYAGGGEAVAAAADLRVARTMWRAPRRSSRRKDRVAEGPPRPPPPPPRYLIVGRGISTLPRWLMAGNPGIASATWLDPKFRLPKPIPGRVPTYTIMMAVYGTRAFDPRFYDDGAPPAPSAAKWHTNTELARMGFSEDRWDAHKDKFLAERVEAAVYANPPLAALLKAVADRAAEGGPAVSIIVVDTVNTWIGVKSSRAVPAQDAKPAGHGANKLGKLYLQLGGRIR